MKVRQVLFALACCAVAACARQEIDAPIAPGFKKVSLQASVAQVKSTIANDGTFAWSEGDVISVYATDGKFYDFTLVDGQQFSGEIPESAEITTVAVYPPVAANGTNDGVFDGTTLNFTLPAEITVKEGCSNVPMVASFEKGADKVAFKQVGAAFKFHVTQAPKDFYMDLTVTGTNPAGTFAIDPAKAGEVVLEGASMEGTATVKAHYVAETLPEAGATLYVPVAVGSYPTLHVKLYELVNGEPVVFYDEDRVRTSGDYTVGRGDIFIMKDIEASITMRIEEVAPIFSDAKVVFAANASATKGYAFYVDDADPVIVEDPAITEYHVGAVYANGKIDPVASGTFEMGSTHTVAVAPVGEDGIIESLKSETVSFTTGHMVQLNGETDNKGPHQVSVWFVSPDFVPRSDYTKVENIYAPSLAGSTSGRKRVYQIQLFESADPTSTPIYDVYTVDRQTVANGAFSTSSWMGKLGGSNLNSPDRISMGYLAPAKTYYFRAKTIDPVTLSCYGGGVEDEFSSAVGESAWSELFPLTTEAEHVAGANEVLYQGFDDLMLAADFVNSASGLVPYLNIYGTNKSNFQSKAKDVLAFPWTGEWTFNNFNTSNTSAQWGVVTGSVYNDKAGSLEGWTAQPNNRIYPGYGNVRIGSNSSLVEDGIISPAIESSLLSDEPISCTVTLRACPTGTDPKREAVSFRVDYLIPDGDGYRAVLGKDLAVETNRYPLLGEGQAFDANNYFYEYGYQEATTMIKLAKGWKIRIVTVPNNDTKRINIDDILVTATPDVPYTGTLDVYENDKKISEPDDTDYDVYKLDGDLPTSFWFAPEKKFDNLETYKMIKDANFNVVLSDNHDYYDAAYNLKILEYCEELGMKYIGKVDGGGWGQAEARQQQCFAQIDQYITHPNYIAQYCGDEPSVSSYTGYSVWHKAFYNRYHEKYPDKFIYVNLFPSYAGIPQMGGVTYEEYIDRWVNEMTGLKSVSFDHYPLTKTRGVITQSYFYNLDLVRSKTLAKRLHFWMIGNGGWVGSTAFEVPEVDMRWNAWTALALGSKGYQYFCYYTPNGGDWVPDQYMINNQTNEPTERYYFAQRLNHDLQYFKSLLQCHADGGIMVPLGKYNMYEPRSSYGALTSVTGDESITGCFRGQDGSYKVLVTHLQPSVAATGTYNVTLHFDSTVTSVATTFSKDGAKADVAVTDGVVTLSIPEGEAYLVEWK